MMSSIQAIVHEASLVPVHLPNINALKEALGKARDWSSKVDHVQVIICLELDLGVTVLNNILSNFEQCGRHNIVQS